MRCDQVDELAAAYALGAVPVDEERVISEHLATCDREHAEARELIGTAAALALSAESVTPSPALRGRLMATIAATPQEHRTAGVAPARAPMVAPATPDRARPHDVRPPAARPWWRLSPVAAMAGAAVLALAIGVGAWNVSLQGRLADREDVLRAIAGATAAHEVSGSAGRGWLVHTDDGPLFVAAELAALPADRLYELWLIAPESAPVPVGTVDEVDGLTVVALERAVGDAEIFAVTVESERVDAPTSDPVLVASIGS